MKKYLYNIDTEGQDGPAKLLRAVGRQKRILEIGCASGVQSKILKEQLGCNVTGIEINPLSALDAAKYCERVIVGDIESMDLQRELGDTRFDVITIADVLEHLRDPAQVLVKLRSHLAGDGYLVASIPNVVHAALILEMALGRFDYRPYGLLDDTHIRFFTLKSIYRLFEEGGYVVRTVDRVARRVEQTELSTHILSPEEMSVLKFIEKNNAEAQTYQFIINATAQTTEVRPQNFGQLEAIDRLKDAELTNNALRQQMRSLESKIAWIESRPLHKTLSIIRRVFSRRGDADGPSPA